MGTGGNGEVYSFSLASACTGGYQLQLTVADTGTANVALSPGGSTTFGMTVNGPSTSLSGLTCTPT
jgi:hypothetical protein